MLYPVKLPIPKHLTHLLLPVGLKNHEGHVTGDIVCTCGCSILKVRYVGENRDTYLKEKSIDHVFFLIIAIQCEACDQEYPIFDEDFHGWNGFICAKETKRQLPRPAFSEWSCPVCSNRSHVMEAEIYSEGQQDFMEETDGSFDPTDWTEAFSWIKLHLQCTVCQKRLKDWVSYETM